ncbi:MAG: hypothetical protein ACYDCQ_12070 [Dehalococcoidia bacterium]
MLTPDRALAFALVAIGLIVVPGPSVLFVVSREIVLGRRAALATALGNNAGLWPQVVAVVYRHPAAARRPNPGTRVHAAAGRNGRPDHGRARPALGRQRAERLTAGCGDCNGGRISG